MTVFGEVVFDNIVQRGERRYIIKDMRFNFKKISALATSALMIGMTAGIAAAATYPKPFVDGGASNVAIVVGSAADALDGIQAAAINNDLHDRTSGTGTTGSSSTVSGNAESLASGSDLIYLNDELNENVDTLTKDNLPTILADGTFTDDDGTDYDYEQTLKVASGATFAFGNSDNDLDDPTLLISLPTSTPGIYNLTLTFDEAVNMSATASEGEEITLFGTTYTVGTATDSDTLVLLGGSDESTVNVGETITLTVDGESYEVTLTGISSSNTAPAAGITVNGESKTFTQGQTKTVGGVDVYVKTVFKTGDNAGYVEIQLGANKLTFEDGNSVVYGSDNKEIEGTEIDIGGTVGAMTSLTVQVFAPDNDANEIVEGDSFIDPVFGTVKVDFADVTNGPVLDGTTDTSTIRNKLSIDKGGDRELLITATDASGNEQTIPFTYHNSTTDDSSSTIHLVEGETMADDDYFILNSGNYQHFMQLTKVDCDASGYVTMKDLFTGESYSTTSGHDWSSDHTDTLTISGQTYTITNVSATTVTVTSSDYSTNKAVFPYIELVSGEDQRFAITDNVQVITGGTDASDISLDLPTGTVAVALVNGGNDTDCNITVSGTGVTTTVLNNGTTEDGIKVGSVDYVFSYTDTSAISKTCAGLNLTVGVESTQAADGVVEWDAPGLLFVEDDDKSETVTTTKNAVFIKTTDTGTYSKALAPVFTSTGYDTQSFDDTDFTGYVTNFGTYVLFDSSDTNQDFASLTYPKTMMYADVYIAEESATITPGNPGSPSSPYNGVVVADNEVSSQNGKNLIIVGGSCINTAAAALVGGSYCGTDFTDNTDVGPGQFLIKGYTDNTLTSGTALLVAGYNKADTVNAAKYLMTQSPDTSKAYIGTSSTSAELVVDTA